MSVEKKTTCGFVIALVFLLAMGVVSLRSINSFIGAFASLDHSHQVLRQLEKSLLALLSTEALGRGYVILGDDQYLQSYQAGTQDVRSDLRELRRLATDDPAQRSKLDELDQLVAKKFAFMDESNRLRSEGKQAELRQLVATREGVELMKQIRRVIQEVKTAEEGLQVERSTRAQNLGLLVNQVVLVVMAVALALGATAITILNRDAAKRGQMGEELERRNREREEAAGKIHALNEDLRRRAALLEAANQELEAFSYSVSHDLRAPLRHVDGFAGLLAKHSAAQLDGQGQRYLKIITDATKRMGQLIDDLLVFSRVGRTAMNVAEVDAGQVVRDTVHDLQIETAGRQIEWSIGALPRVRVDPALFRQVFSNLLGNAVKYTRNKSPARIEVGHWTSPNQAPDGSGASHSEAGENVFFVRDNGAGFDMQYAGKLFGVFQRLHTSAEFEGTGIGLANVHRIVLRHGGRTWAEGKIGEGATFFFALPAGT
jgi:signal transduction histidine kinase